MPDHLTDLERKAIQALKAFEPEDGYYLCYSGGKDSDVIRILADLAGVKHDIHHNLTTADAPETVRYVQSIPGVIIDRPEISMWRLIEKKMMPPTRLMRYCCEVLKECGGAGRLKVTGVRKHESATRAKQGGLVKIIGKLKAVQSAAETYGAPVKQTDAGGIVMNLDNDPARRLVEHCYRTTSTMLNPIIDWTDDDVWAFLRAYGCESNPLYQCGMKRVGCIGCPMAGRARYREFAQWPKYRAMYAAAFDRMLAARTAKGKDNGTWTDGEAVMRWWLGEDETQLRFEDIGGQYE